MASLRTFTDDHEDSEGLLAQKSTLTGCHKLCFLLAVVALAASAIIVLAYSFGAGTSDDVTPLNTPLLEYVKTYDPVYSWFEIPNSRISAVGYTGYVLNMTSQTWLDAATVQNNPWWHLLAIIVPDNIRGELRDSAVLFIGGGSMSRGVPTATNSEILQAALIATTGGFVVAYLYQVPNEPLVFTAEGRARTEDEIIAYAWDHFYRFPDQPEWLPRLPMTKAAVRAMDSITSFMSSLYGGTVTVPQRYVVTGASKRGWTTWTTGAADSRVVGIAPLVMDLLKMQSTLDLHYRSLAGWSFAFNDYYEMNLTLRLHDPETQLLADVVDPITYKDILGKIPKLVIIGASDEFFLPDDMLNWWDDLPGEKHFRAWENDGHSLSVNSVRVAQLLASFSLSVFSGYRRPEYDWSIAKVTGTITFRPTYQNPTRVTVWSANSAVVTGTRDFRWLACPNGCNSFADIVPTGVTWTNQTLIQNDDNTYTAARANPATGWLAFFIVAEYNNPAQGLPMSFTTGVSIVPQTYPAEMCEGEGCRGILT